MAKNENEKNFIEENVEIEEVETEVTENEDNIDEIFEKDKSFKKRIIIFLGTIIFIAIAIAVMYYFFYQRVDLQMNISTDKQIEFVYLNGNKEQLTTQKYISDLDYTMRYDINNFKVFKYQSEDIYKSLHEDEVVIKVEKSKAPSSCSGTSAGLTFAYSNCEVIVNSNMEEYYVYDSDKTYKITVNLPQSLKNTNNYYEIINLMLNSFHMGND